LWVNEFFCRLSNQNLFLRLCGSLPVLRPAIKHIAHQSLPLLSQTESATHGTGRICTNMRRLRRNTFNSNKPPKGRSRISLVLTIMSSWESDCGCRLLLKSNARLSIYKSTTRHWMEIVLVKCFVGDSSTGRRSIQACKSIVLHKTP
jgi:hypothetical protein